LAALIVPAGAFAHAERPSYYPNFDPITKKYGDPFGSVPAVRKSGPALVVCKKDSAKRLTRQFKGRKLAARLALLDKCKFKHIQAAVDAAANGTRILVMPGIYKEEPSRAAQMNDPKCKGDFTENEGNKVPSYDYQLKCPNDQNLIAIIGDGPDKDRKCDRKCNIQIEGMGKDTRGVLIQGDRKKLNVIRADRADGVVLRNFTIEYSDFNNIYALETNGFRFSKIQSRYSREYGLLSFASDNGMYEYVDAYGSGDSGIYPGSGPEGHCKRYGIEIRKSNSHHNTIGSSGTAGNGIYAHDNKFHHNGAGLTTDSFAAGHPGMPQDCAKWESNEFYSNNYDLFNAEMDAYCKKPYVERDPKKTCPTFQVPVGTGLLIAGGNGNIARNNYFYDNWRQGIMLLWVPTAFRGEDSTGQSINDPANQYDTSNKNEFSSNSMGVRPDGTRDPNGVDFWWDEEGAGNCWSGNKGPGGAAVTADPATLPACPTGSAFSMGRPEKQAPNVPCASWNPVDNTDPPGCDWFTQPAEPK
jgi:hypothetical protein